MSQPTERPLGWVLVRPDGTPVRPSGQDARLYASLALACEAETRYRNKTRCRALPTPVWSREAWRADHLHEEEDA